MSSSHPDTMIYFTCRACDSRIKIWKDETGMLKEDGHRSYCFPSKAQPKLVKTVPINELEPKP